MAKIKEKSPECEVRAFRPPGHCYHHTRKKEPQTTRTRIFRHAVTLQAFRLSQGGARRRYILRSRTEATAAMEPTRFVAALSQYMKANMGKVSN